MIFCVKCEIVWLNGLAPIVSVPGDRYNLTGDRGSPRCRVYVHLIKVHNQHFVPQLRRLYKSCFYHHTNVFTA